jgi:hypothetical protein
VCQVSGASFEICPEAVNLVLPTGGITPVTVSVEGKIKYDAWAKKQNVEMKG